MNSPAQPDPNRFPSAPAAPPPQETLGSREIEDPGILGRVGELWDGRWLILASLVGFLGLGALYVWCAQPLYQTDALLQIQDKKERPSDTALTKMENLFPEPAEAEAEIEIIKSNLVLGRTVRDLHLDLKVEAVAFPVLGPALARRNPNAPAADLDLFEVPDHLRGEKFRLTILDGGRFRLNGPGGAEVASGKPGETVAGTFNQEPIQVRVQRLVGAPGKAFDLTLLPLGDVLDDLRTNLDVAEKKKLTGVLGLSFRGPSPSLCPKVLNGIVDQYVRQKQERRIAEIAKAQEILKAKMPELKARLDAAEDRLHGFRSKAGAVDLTREASLVLEQKNAIDQQISGLQQRREDLLRTYRPNSDVVVTLDQQIASLQQEADKISARTKILPATQQEFVRLTRDVEAQNELYTALQNNIQQLQVAMAGEIGNVTVVDRAVQPLDPIAPKKGVLMVLFFLLGLGGGIALVALRRMFMGIEDHRIIESRLGLPVLVTIPHSRVQEKLDETMRKGGGMQILASVNPGDLAVESLRSLRTTLNFAIRDSRNPVVVVTGPSPMIGKSFVSVNLAIVLAQSKAKVLLVDGDLRKGNLHRHFGFKNRFRGLSEVLFGDLAWADAVQETEFPGLSVLTTGSMPPNPSELLLSPRLETFIQEVSAAFDYVVIDAPPLLPVTDATILASKAATVFLVARFGKHSLDEIRATKQRLETHGIRMNGYIFNDVRIAAIGSKYRYGHYVYHYGYED